MRMLTKNKQTVWYSNYSGKSELKDEYGNNLGEWELTYTPPTKAAWNIRYAESDSEVQAFGVQARETIVIVAERAGFSLTQESVLWYGVEPTIKQDGTTDTAHNYRVVGIRPSLNTVKFYAQRVSVTQVVKQETPEEGDG